MSDITEQRCRCCSGICLCVSSFVTEKGLHVIFQMVLDKHTLYRMKGNRGHEHRIQFSLRYLCSLLDANTDCLPRCRFIATGMSTPFLPDLVCSRLVKAGSCDTDRRKTVGLKSRHLAPLATPSSSVTWDRLLNIPASVSSSGR